MWLGWAMLAALVYSAIPPMILGRMKLPLADALHDKTLFANAHMDHADWKTGAAASLGIVGIGAGLWWADAAAACVIALDIIRDGFRNVRTAIADLMNRHPMTVDESKLDPLPEALVDRLKAFAYVKDADVRLREEGHVFIGEAFVVLRDETDVVAKVWELSDAAHAFDWRLHGLTVMPVKEVSPGHED